jgi:hypothetical protein
VLSGCGDGNGSLPTSASSGDCAANIRFHGVVYLANTRVDQAAPKGRSIGPGAVLDCDHRTVVARVVVSTVKGVDSHLAISVRSGYRGVYVAEDLPRGQWPAIVRSE